MQDPAEFYLHLVGQLHLAISLPEGNPLGLFARSLQMPIQSLGILTSCSAYFRAGERSSFPPHGGGNGFQPAPELIGHRQVIIRNDGVVTEANQIGHIHFHGLEHDPNIHLVQGHLVAVMPSGAGSYSI